MKVAVARSPLVEKMVGNISASNGLGTFSPAPQSDSLIGDWGEEEAF
jgi:hypothetical protein